jgi:hypothetical protein
MPFLHQAGLTSAHVSSSSWPLSVCVTGLLTDLALLGSSADHLGLGSKFFGDETLLASSLVPATMAGTLRKFGLNALWVLESRVAEHRWPQPSCLLVFIHKDTQDHSESRGS